MERRSDRKRGELRWNEKIKMKLRVVVSKVWGFSYMFLLQQRSNLKFNSRAERSRGAAPAFSLISHPYSLHTTTIHVPQSFVNLSQLHLPPSSLSPVPSPPPPSFKHGHLSRSPRPVELDTTPPSPPSVDDCRPWPASGQGRTAQVARGVTCRRSYTAPERRHRDGCRTDPAGRFTFKLKC